MRNSLWDIFEGMLPTIPVYLAFLTAYLVEQHNWPFAAATALLCIVFAVGNLGVSIARELHSIAGQIGTSRP